jgi:class 3 adenylate cyclase/tetratricopeptide (TPR) repeat protein
MTAERLPSGRVTFLFTDIQGSTRLWDAFPEEMQAALAAHNQIIDEAVAGGGGRVVKNTGDGVFAVFPSAPGAVEAAITAQSRLATHEWDPVIGSIEVRMALHTDDVEAVGGDYHGPAVNRVARIEAAGHGGQVLLSGATQVEVAPALPSGAGLIDLGDHRLRGLSEVETIYQLVAPALRSSFPPLRTASVAVGHMPDFATSFVGRAADIERLGERLADSGCRMVTALGPGGIGKTRLAVEAARRFGESAGLVPHFVSLAAVSSAEAIIKEIADSLNYTIDLHVSGMVDETSQVLDLLEPQRMILILDNFEHLLQGVGVVSRIVETAPNVKVLVTSRERLGIASEWVYEVDGLDLPVGTDQPEGSDAVALFVDRARRAGAIIESSDDVAALCTLLGGMPLAIELAAAWSPMLPVVDIADEIRANLDFLSMSRADVPERHHSIRAAFGQTWNRLPSELRTAFAGLSIFSAPFTRDAAAAVTGTNLSTLLELMNKSLLRRSDFDTYDIHPLLREFGLEQLGAGRQSASERHSAYYIGRLLDRGERLHGSIDQIEVKDEVASELGNLRQAALWSATRQPAPDLVPILHDLKAFYFLHSWAEGIDHFEAIADAIEEQLGSAAALDDVAYLWARTYAMVFLANLGHIDRVTEVCNILLPHWEVVGGAGLSSCLTALGIAAEERGDLVEARRLLQRGAEIGFGTNSLMEIESASWFGWVVFEQGEVELAQQIFRSALDIAEAKSTYPGRAYLLSKLGVAADGLGDHEAAAQYHHEGREIFVKTGDLGGQGYTLSRLSWTYWLMGDYGKAKRYGEEGLEKFDEINHRWGVAASWCRIGLAELGLGDPGAAADAFRTGLESAVRHQMQTLTYYALMGMGRVYGAEGKLDRAILLLAHNQHAPQNPYAELAREALDELVAGVTEEMIQRGREMTLEDAIATARG